MSNDHDAPATPPPAAVPLAATADQLTQEQADEWADLLGESLVNELYMHIFHRRSARTEEIARAGFDAEAVPPALTVLAARGLISTTENGEWVVVPPSRSFPALAARLEERARLLRTSLPGLTSAYRAAGGAPESPHLQGLEILHTKDDVAFAITQCFSQARAEMRVMRRDSFASRRAAFEAMPALKAGRVGVAKRNIDCVTVLHTDLAQQIAPEDLDWFVDAPHERLLLSGQVPFTAVVSDENMAVVETERDGRTAGLLISHPAVVHAIREVVNMVMDSATVWQRGGQADPSADELQPAEREILDLLSLGVPDSTIARRLGISPRTFDRRMRALLDKLGAATRFQAGVIASRRGWL